MDPKSLGKSVVRTRGRRPGIIEGEGYVIYQKSPAKMPQLKDGSVALTILVLPDSGTAKGYDSYLKQLAKVYKEIDRVSRPDGFCAVVFSKNHYMQDNYSLPSDLSKKILKLGWRLHRDFYRKDQDQIVEYVLVFGRNDKPKAISDFKQIWQDSERLLEALWNTHSKPGDVVLNVFTQISEQAAKARKRHNRHFVYFQPPHKK